MATIHPHRGYLNTCFKFYTHSTEEVNYEVFPNEYDKNSPIITGRILPYVPHSIKLNRSGIFHIKFSDGTSSEIMVEDGYKFGGSKYKKSFIFDNIPWCFIMMHDRTYFYNRKTEESYVEVISPDNIIPISKDFVIFENENQNEKIIYSLTEQKPILNISDIIVKNEDYIVWLETNEEDPKKLIIYSLSKRTIEKSCLVDEWIVDPEENAIIYTYHNSVSKQALRQQLPAEHTFRICGKVETLVSPNIIISLEKKFQYNDILLYDSREEKLISRIHFDSAIASINKKTILQEQEEISKIKEFDIASIKSDEVKLMATFITLNFYPTQWDIYYTIDEHTIKRNIKYVKNEYSHKINTALSDIDFSLKKPITSVLSSEESICFYNNSETILFGKNFKPTIFSNTEIFSYDNNIILHKDNRFYHINNAIGWELISKHKLTFSEFYDFGLIKDEDNNSLFDLHGNVYEGLTVRIFQPFKYIINANHVFINGVKLPYETLSNPNTRLSESYKIGVTEEDKKIYLLSITNNKIIRKRILSDLYDQSSYYSVLLSEDGSQIMYRDGNSTVIQDVLSGNKNIFNNQSYIQQYNGIRPSFHADSNRQAILINPVTGLPIPNAILSRYVFSSPNGSLYADTNLDEYIEYHHSIENRQISKEEYNAVVGQYSYLSAPNSQEYINVKKAREQIVRNNLYHFKSQISDAISYPSEELITDLIDEKNIWGNSRFISFIVKKRGNVVIKRTSDDSVVAKIDIGKPLWFLNYVSFSYDGRYVAIAGRYPDNTRDDDGNKIGGLLLCFDLIDRKIISEKTNINAVWTTSFTKNGSLAAYTSNPITFLQLSPEDNIIELPHYSFLTFSPDGNLFALSRKGYVRFRDCMHNWGHQNSTEVFICRTDMPDKVLCSYNDISEVGIESMGRQAGNVASVAFSNDNKRLLIVSSDGVMILRNLNL